MEVENISQIINDEKMFSIKSYFGEKHAERETLVIENESPILITAPHAIKHSRHGEVKGADEYTGSLAIWLSKKLDANMVVGHHYNPDLEHITQLNRGFLQGLDDMANRSSLIIDLHGMKDTHPSGLCISSGYQSIDKHPISSVLDNTLYGMSKWEPSHNSPFNAQAPYTVVSHAENVLGVPAIQLEIPRRFRVPGSVSTEEYFEYWNTLSEALELVKIELQ